MSLIKVNMNKEEVVLEPFPADKILGGRALVDYLLTEYGSPTGHPLAEESIAIVAPGLLAGTSAPQSGRLSLGGKSPLTGGIKESNSGGTAANKLGRLGIRGIMIDGKAKEWKILKVTAQGATLDPAGDVVGLKNYAACDRLRERYGDKIGVIIIGRAGEMKMASATVAVTDPEGRPSRHAARGGLGAVLGAKGIKAIVIDDKKGNLRRPANEAAFKAATRAATESIQNAETTNVLHSMGTPAWIGYDNERGSLPSYNHHEGSFDKVDTVKIETFLEINKANGGTMGHSCMPGCPVRCSPIFHDNNGNFLTAAFEYETIVLLGTNLGIDNLEAVARMDRKCYEYGIDTMELGNAIGVLSDVGLFEFGDAAKAEAYVDEVGEGTFMGRILGSGVANTARIFGIERVPAVKGQGLPGHSARSSKGWGVTYATSPQGADHTAGPVVDEFVFSSEGQDERSRAAQITFAALDSTGVCWFSFLGPESLFPMVNGFYDLNWSLEVYLEIGREALRRERAFNAKAGFSKADDRLPDWMTKEPLGPTNEVFDVPNEDLDRVFNF